MLDRIRDAYIGRFAIVICPMSHELIVKYCLVVELKKIANCPNYIFQNDFSIVLSYVRLFAEGNFVLS